MERSAGEASQNVWAVNQGCGAWRRSNCAHLSSAYICCERLGRVKFTIVAVELGTDGNVQRLKQQVKSLAQGSRDLVLSGERTLFDG